MKRMPLGPSAATVRQCWDLEFAVSGKGKFWCRGKGSTETCSFCRHLQIGEHCIPVQDECPADHSGKFPDTPGQVTGEPTPSRRLAGAPSPCFQPD
jgi:hypothetical protein